MLELYDFPLEFWRKVLGEEMHYHMGHFFSPVFSLTKAMRMAVSDLFFLLPRELSQKPLRILDVGCGWGGPAFQLAATLKFKPEITGLVYNRTQADYVNMTAAMRHSPVSAIQADVQDFNFGRFGKFDLAWICESLDHMEQRQKVLLGLREVADVLALAVHCRASRVPRAELYSDFFGIPSVESRGELLALLEAAGWNTYRLVDQTHLILPTFWKWRGNLGRISKKYSQEVSRLLQAHDVTEKLYQNGSLFSIQLTAR